MSSSSDNHVRASFHGKHGRSGYLLRLCLAFMQFPVTVRLQAVPMLRFTPRPVYGDALNLFGMSQPEQQALIAGREITATSLGKTSDFSRASFKNNSRPNHIAMIPTHQLDTDPPGLIHRFRFISKQYDRRIGVADDHIGPTIVVQVTDGKTPTYPQGLKKRSSFSADILEDSMTLMTEVGEQDGSLLLQTLLRKSPDVAIGNDQIFPTIIIEVNESSAETDELLADGRDAGSARTMAKQFLILVLVESVEFTVEIRNP